ncbi:MAG: hypothetical protein A3K10_08725 [Bacteroidetes bacterium RIFCSPLOWO2_12_FULL_31_6]|nr:MAG: hypothetical protein A3K10_08725 [Bacteroidetes bacterium RIFCSPLOWO2_12_FULL_31_6]
MKRILLITLFIIALGLPFILVGNNPNDTNRVEVNQNYNNSLLIGYNYFKYSTFEVGFARTKIRWNTTYFPADFKNKNIYWFKGKDAVFVYVHGNDPIIGIRLSYTSTIISNISLSLKGGYYTDFSKNQIVLRPEVGVFFPFSKKLLGLLNYSYGQSLISNSLNLNIHQIGLRFYFGL